MGSHIYPALRHRVLDDCFRDRTRKYFIEDLRDKCNEVLLREYGIEICKRQIYSDITFMRDTLGAPIESVYEGKRTYYIYTDREFSIFNQPLSVTQTEQLRLAISTLTSFRGLPNYDWIEEFIVDLQNRFHLVGSNESLVGFSQNQELTGLRFLSPIINAALSHQVLKINYHNYKNGGRDLIYILHPYYLKQYNNRWFLFGKDNKHLDKLSTLALDRIVAIKLVKNIEFVPNTDVDFEHYFDNIVGVSVPRAGTPTQTIIMRTNEHRWHYIMSKPIHLSQKIEDRKKHLFSIKVVPTRELEQQILSFGPDLEVISPADYRNQIKKKIEESLKNYGMQNGSTTND